MFFILPTRVEGSESRQTVPFVNALLIACNVLAFALGWSRYWAVGPGAGPLSVVTYAFAHVGFWHLAVNMWLLLLLGAPVNRRLGNFYYACTYLGTVVTIGLLGRLLSSGYMVGSSGAIFAVIAVFVCLMPSSRIDFYYLAIFPMSLLFGLFKRPTHWLFWLIRWDEFSLRAVWAIALVPMLEIWGLFWWGWNWTNLAQLLGLVCGVAAVLLLPATITMNKRRAAWGR